MVLGEQGSDDLRCVGVCVNMCFCACCGSAAPATNDVKLAIQAALTLHTLNSHLWTCNTNTHIFSLFFSLALLKIWQDNNHLSTLG